MESVVSAVVGAVVVVDFLLACSAWIRSRILLIREGEEDSGFFAPTLGLKSSSFEDISLISFSVNIAWHKLHFKLMIQPSYRQKTHSKDLLTSTPLDMLQVWTIFSWSLWLLATTHFFRHTKLDWNAVQKEFSFITWNSLFVYFCNLEDGWPDEMSSRKGQFSSRFAFCYTYHSKSSNTKLCSAKCHAMHHCCISGTAGTKRNETVNFSAKSVQSGEGSSLPLNSFRVDTWYRPRSERAHEELFLRLGSIMALEIDMVWTIVCLSIKIIFGFCFYWEFHWLIILTDDKWKEVSSDALKLCKNIVCAITWAAYSKQNICLVQLKFPDSVGIFTQNFFLIIKLNSYSVWKTR